VHVSRPFQRFRVIIQVPSQATYGGRLLWWVDLLGGAKQVHPPQKTVCEAPQVLSRQGKKREPE